MFWKYAVLGVGILTGALGCSYATGTMSYTQNPELRSVRLYAGDPDPEGENLGVVEVIREAAGDCSDLANEALTALLAEAKALDGTGVKDVKFRGRYHWMGRVVCRRSLSGMSVQVRGMATR